MGKEDPVHGEGGERQLTEVTVDSQRKASGGAETRTSISIVCVYNEPGVLASCLHRSVNEGLTFAPETELIAVDNCDSQFSTAGAALNHGARQASNPVIVFVHQDVYLHSLAELERAANELERDETIGVMGAAGIDRRGRMHGRIRDRVLGLGAPAPQARSVESIDEVLFLVEREQVLESPLADRAELGWHAYAVEYSARMRSEGRRAVARDIPLTHNSLSTNLHRLDVAHRWVGDSYRELLPLRTTCGTIGARRAGGALSSLARKAEGVARWERESRAARNSRSVQPLREVVLDDIRFVVDEIARETGASRIHSLDRARSDALVTRVAGLERFGRPFFAASVDVEGMSAAVLEREDDELLVLANLEDDDLTRLKLPPGESIVGFSQEARLWAVVGAHRAELATLWPNRRSLPYAGLVR